MLVLHPWVQGYLANDELVWPLLDVVAGTPAPVYIHTGPPGNATPWQVVDLAERYPSVDFILGHCGATDFWNDVVEAGKAMDNIVLESSFARPFLFVVYLREVGVRKGIMGSSAPLNELVFEWEQMRGALPPEQWGDVYGNNLARLLEKRGAL
jgi:predicted TIM-barrel fold metal-dependent hydrolase